MTSLENRLPSLGLEIDTAGVKGDEDAVESLERSRNEGSVNQWSLCCEGTAFAAVNASDKAAILVSSKTQSESRW